MSIVPDLLKLALLLGLGLTCLTGLGWLLVGPLLHGSLTMRKKDAPLLLELPLALLCGLITNYGITLLFQALPLSLWVGILAGLLGAGACILAIIRSPGRQRPAAASLIRWSGAALAGFLILGPLLTEPIKDWDARSIWFFQARMLYLAGTLGPAAGWQSPGLGFSHTDYPKLLAGLAAQVAQGLGYWNEYLPKAALFFMLIPAVLWLFGLARRTFSSALLLLLMVFGFYRYIWNGYMDGLLATYFTLSMLMLGRYLQTSKPLDLFSSLACLLFLPCLKNEGDLAALAGLVPILLIWAWRFRPSSFRVYFQKRWKIWLAETVLLLPTVIWSYDKTRWNLANDLQLGSADTLSRLLVRLADGSFPTILLDAYAQIQGTSLLVVALLLAYLLIGKGTLKGLLPSVLAGGLYALGMILVYLVTPRDLTWHLISSIDRTMLAVNGCLFGAAYFIFQALEDTPGNKNNTSPVQRQEAAN